MEKYLVPAVPDQSRRPRRRWDRSSVELEGRFSGSYRHRASQLLMDSYTEIARFRHNEYEGAEACPTNMVESYIRREEFIHALGSSYWNSGKRGVSSMEFDSKGIYLASVTGTGCLTVHDFDLLCCSGHESSSNLVKNEAKQLLHHSSSKQLNAVRWNPENQDEIACASRLKNKILLFDIGYISSQPSEVLQKHGAEGLYDVIFASDGSSRLLASGLDGNVYLWDRRSSSLPLLELTTNSTTQLNSIQLDLENRVVFGAGKQGIIYAWDLRAAKTSFAFQSHNKVHHPLLAFLKLSSMFEKINSLKAQSYILPREIYSINFNPSCPYQLSFHLSNGWSGAININTFDLTHIHCPPPAWECTDVFDSLLDMRKPSWLPICSIYAVPCHTDPGIYLLDLYPDSTSACHVDSSDDSQNVSIDSYRVSRNKFVRLSEDILACAAHPLNGTIVAGTKESSLLIVSQKNTDEEVPRQSMKRLLVAYFGDHKGHERGQLDKLKNISSTNSSGVEPWRLEITRRQILEDNVLTTDKLPAFIPQLQEHLLEVKTTVRTT